jgi:hypothetical protein
LEKLGGEKHRTEMNGGRESRRPRPALCCSAIDVDDDDDEMNMKFEVE